VIRAVVKWSYVKGASGLGKAKAHINYIQFREGEDRGRGPREFFNEDKEHVLGRAIKERLDELEQRGVQVHKFILSPGIENVEMREYTREMMDNLSRSKGLDLEWYAVEHRNTEHQHAHVVVMGTDFNGRKVEFDREDSKHMRQWGDRYLEREHQLERYLDREIERLLKEPERVPELEYKRARGDKDYERWMYGDERDKRDRGDAERDRREWELLDKDLHKAFKQERSAGRPTTYKQYQTESAGRLLDFHEKHQEREAQEYWQDIAENFPELAKDAQRELQWLDQLAQDRPQKEREPDLDKLLDGLDPVDREMRDFIDREWKDLEREGVDLWERQRLDDKTRDAIDPIRNIFGAGEKEKEPEREAEIEHTPQPEPEQEPDRGDAWQTFEADRSTRGEMGREEENERDRGDDRDDPEHTFGR
jgi:hypothetical protein